MERFVRSIRHHLQRARGVERFVRLIVGGGISLVAGLWTLTLADARSLPWLFGTALVLLGVGGFVAGLRSEIDY